jgi:hypothetical protein
MNNVSPEFRICLELLQEVIMTIENHENNTKKRQNSIRTKTEPLDQAKHLACVGALLALGELKKDLVQQIQQFLKTSNI